MPQRPYPTKHVIVGKYSTNMSSQASRSRQPRLSAADDVSAKPVLSTHICRSEGCEVSDTSNEDGLMDIISPLLDRGREVAKQVYVSYPIHVYPIVPPVFLIVQPLINPPPPARPYYMLTHRPASLPWPSPHPNVQIRSKGLPRHLPIHNRVLGFTCDIKHGIRIVLLEVFA